PVGALQTVGATTLLRGGGVEVVGNEGREQAHRMINRNGAVAARHAAAANDSTARRDRRDTSRAVDAVAVGKSAEAAGATVQLDVVAQVRVEHCSLEDQAHALDLQLIEVARGVVAGVHAGQVVGRVGDLVKIVVRLDAAADAQLERD